ncbi:hypothetical protein BC943DRAFT_39256 [Umbelopsis sp. AD052]|nr:hypothetical protein BC943DRAFT_39256 [Umbelopsis sp. AD052]
MDANVLLIDDSKDGWMDSLDVLPIQRKREGKDGCRLQHTIKAGRTGNSRQTFGRTLKIYTVKTKCCPLSSDESSNLYKMNQRSSLIAFSQCIIKRALSTKPIINRPPLTPKQNEAIQSNQEVLSSYMVPGKLKRFFKSRPTRSQALETENISSSSTTFRSARPRKLTEQRFGDPPSIAQQQLAQRIERAILKMNASEALPSRFVTPEHIRVVGHCLIYRNVTCTGDRVEMPNRRIKQSKR